MTIDSDRPIICGELVELWSSRRGRLSLHKPTTTRWLLWHPRKRSLSVVKPGPRLAEQPTDEDMTAVRSWVWDDVPVSIFRVDLPRAEALPRRPLGRLERVVYYQEKGGERAEWDHPFERQPRLLVDADGEFVVSGRVEADERGILS